MKLLDGKEISNQIKVELAEEVKVMLSDGQRAPHLAAIIVGNDPASETYVASKVKACKKIGFDSTLVRLDADVSEQSLLDQIEAINTNKKLTD